MESEGIHKVIKDALIAEKEATRRRSLSSSAISSSDMIYYDELEKSC